MKKTTKIGDTVHFRPDAEAKKLLQHALELMDGRMSVTDIANECVKLAALQVVDEYYERMEKRRKEVSSILKRGESVSGKKPQ